MRVAVKIPLYNAESTILDTLESFLNQTHQDFIIYIYDNASTDTSIQQIKTLEDSRIVIVTAEKNKNWYKNFNRCLGVCDERYLLIAHADDVYHPQFLEKNLDALKTNKPRLLFTSGTKFRSYEEIKYTFPISDCVHLDIYENHESLLGAIVKSGNFIFSPTAFGYSSDILNLISFFDGDQFGGSADLDAWLRYVNVQSIGIIKTKGLFFHRVSESQISYNDLGLDDPVFIKCCSFHIKTALIDAAKRSELELCLNWHKVYYGALRYLTGLNSTHLPQFNELHAAISANVSSKKKVKIVFLFLLCKFISYLPAKAQSALGSALLKRVRKS
ncbi:glycosyltransferase [Alphaproteobacteria bacterium]|nr:glycosyltransferase [Alphaproteobacteria bacterium]